MKRLLVVSPDANWIEFLQIALEAYDVEVTGVPGPRSVIQSLAALRSSKFASVLISALAAPGQHQSDALLEATDVLDALRKADKIIPLLVWSPFPSERLESIASRSSDTVLLANDAPSTIAAALADSPLISGPAPRTAKVELQIGAASIRTEVALDGKLVGASSSRDWAGRCKMGRLEEQFAKWTPIQRSGGSARYTDNWFDVLKVAGEDISYETDYAGQAVTAAISKCLDEVGTLDRVHVRFNLLSPGPDSPNPFVNVPFEMLYDPLKKNFVRSLAPIARRVCLSSESRTASALTNAAQLTGQIIFVKSDAHGRYEFPGPGGARMFGPLQALDVEFDAVDQARKLAELVAPEELALTADGNALAVLRNRLDAAPSAQTPKPQIIHYAGHSIRADNDTTYLILPGRAPGDVLPLRVSEFAAWARKAEVQLVILSSCESSGPEAVFRLSQAGIPAVIGFRWEVNDKEAAFFTGQLHELLGKQVPLARAFHAAGSAVRTAFPHSPTFVSPMLVVQDDEWTTV
ncbi:CHAT domain-containing protein (plasmid) [Rhizobium sp. TH2]|uniref:CHAT domain-containing protein n=1 Tax=Rhizobium sp. TH2 TaxID=2775403 RepID=UPI0021587DC4|nr:CHAT domain-containing protein [Rhizobium sp. TH2]UVC12306.1 CHAT domain-containing protein [Rhizobium sp. TH2]